MLAINKQNYSVCFGGHRLLLNGLASLYWPEKKLLVIADLHLEKGSYFAQRGNPLPLYDSLDTLHCVQQLINFYQPHKILSLGDNIHDAQAFERMNEKTYLYLQTILGQIDEWGWIIGNHDCQIMPQKLSDKLQFYDHLAIENITFSHDFQSDKPLQIVGHYHPKIKVEHINGKCFLINANKIIMPSFGRYTGGHNVNSESFKVLINRENFNILMIHREKIWRVK